MSLAGRTWHDSTENYCDGYVLKVSGSTATAILGNSYSQPVSIFGISITVNSEVSTGLVDFRDSSATGDNDPTIWSVRITSGSIVGVAGFQQYVMPFYRGLTFNNGIVITATTVTGSISVLYKARYS